jgi:hypothetical protein
MKNIKLDSNGFYYFCGLDSHQLREIAAELDKINKPLNNSIEEYFRKENEKRNNCKHDFEKITDFLNDEIYICKKCGLDAIKIPNLY